MHPRGNHAPLKKLRSTQTHSSTSQIDLKWEFRPQLRSRFKSVYYAHGWSWCWYRDTMWPWDEIWFYFPILGSFSHFRITQIPILGSFRYHLTSTSKSNVMAYLSMPVQNFPHTRPWTRSYLLDWYLKALIWPYTVCLGTTKLFFLNLGIADRLYMFSSLDIDKTVEKTVYISIPTHIHT